MKLGTAKCKITPQMPVRLAGYASRKAEFEGIKEDIYLRVHVHRTDSAQAVFIYADIIWWDTQLVSAARKALLTNFNLQPEEIHFIASHNHSGPPTGSSFVPALETYSREYAEFLLQSVVAAVGTAMNDLTAVTVNRYDTQCKLNVFRRVMKDGKITMLPNTEAFADNNLTVLAFTDMQKKTKGLIVHYPCHANISGENCVQPDYPGIALRLVDEEYPSSISIFMQGCTGDLRPNLTENGRFLQGDYACAAKFAQTFAAACKAALQETPKPVEPDLKCALKSISLPVDTAVTPSELEQAANSDDEITRQWAQCVKSKGCPDREILRLKYLSYAKNLSFYFFSAEVSQYYAIYARSLDANALCTAYTDGMIGYICTEKQISEGGYEPVGSARYFALSGTFSPKTEEIIMQQMKQIKETVK